MYLRATRRRIFLCIFTTSLFIYFADFSLLESNTGVLDENNYLEAKGPREVLIDLPGCVIPLEVEPAEVLVSDNPNCDTSRPRFTYVIGDKIWLNSSFSATCCYKGIVRHFGSDNNVSTTQECTPVDSEGTQVTLYDAVTVICNHGGSVYDDYQTIVRSKVRLPAFPSKTNVPNIVIVGLDSVSRFHFHKLMPKTKHFLDRMGAIEMLGYTKVGENTFPNAIAFLTGYEEEQVIRFCYNRSIPIDSCPFLWNDLNMTTAFLEDAPRLAIFNYFKFGFLHPPTDHYLRPLMLSVLSDYYPFKNMFPCVGSRSTEAFILDHVRQLMDAARSNSKPLFSFAWLTSLAHENTNNLPAADDLFYEFFQSLNLANTIMILMSDHGHRYGNMRISFNGWFNEKLPFFTVVFPPSVRKFLGKQRMQAIESNARKLTTPFDVYHTLADIMRAYNVKDFDTTTVAVNNQPFPRTRGQSLFTEISPTRNCKTAGIPKDFCACSKLQPMDLSNPLLEMTVRYAISRINKWIPRRCRRLEVAKITAGAQMNDEEFIVGFTTKPGGFRLETIGRFDGSLVNYRIARVSGITGVWCISDWFVEYYCQCDFLGLILEYVWGN